MADRFYGTARADAATSPQVTVSTSTTSKEIELRVLEGADITVKDVALALDRILDAVMRDTGRSDI